MKKGAIFDLDGTLVSSIGLHESVWDEVFRRHGVELTPDELKEQSGKKNTLFVKIILDRRGRTDLDAQAVSDEKDAGVIAALVSNPPAVFPGVHELFAELKARGVKLALATSATKATALLLGKELLGYFDAHVYAEDIERGKPDPDMFLKAADRIGLAPMECVVFEDAKSGAEAARAGGFFCIARDNHLGQDLSAADKVIENYDVHELMELF